MKIDKKESQNSIISSKSIPFKIFSKFKESGDQPSAIQNLVKNLLKNVQLENKKLF